MKNRRHHSEIRTTGLHSMPAKIHQNNSIAVRTAGRMTLESIPEEPATNISPFRLTEWMESELSSVAAAETRLHSTVDNMKAYVKKFRADRYYTDVRSKQGRLTLDQLMDEIEANIVQDEAADQAKMSTGEKLAAIEAKAMDLISRYNVIKPERLITRLVTDIDCMWSQADEESKSLMSTCYLLCAWIRHQSKLNLDPVPSDITIQMSPYFETLIDEMISSETPSQLPP